jgi:hypothetical protein
MEEGSHPIKLTAATKPLKLFAFNLLLALIYIGTVDFQSKTYNWLSTTQNIDLYVACY